MVSYGYWLCLQQMLSSSLLTLRMSNVGYCHWKLYHRSFPFCPPNHLCWRSLWFIVFLLNYYLLLLSRYPLVPLPFFHLWFFWLSSDAFSVWSGILENLLLALSLPLNADCLVYGRTWSRCSGLKVILYAPLLLIIWVTVHTMII